MTDKNDFINKNLGLVHSCCSKFKGRGIEYEDMFQAGCIGLIKATKGFDETRGLMFSTYAVPVILGEIKRMFRDGGTVKVGRTLKELSLKVVRENERLSKTLGREPTVSEIAVSFCFKMLSSRRFALYFIISGVIINRFSSEIMLIIFPANPGFFAESL